MDCGLLRQWIRRLFTPARRPRPSASRSRPTFRPTLESLEIRLTPSVTFAGQQTVGTGNGPYAVAVADFNGDGRPDLVTANYTDGTVSVLLNTTNAGATAPSFAVQETFSVGSNPYSVAVGDFNGDGRPDIVVANRNAAGTVTILLNTTAPGATVPSFAAPQTFAVGNTPYAVAVGDFSDDGRADIAVANSGSGTVSVLMDTPPALGRSLHLRRPEDLRRRRQPHFPGGGRLQRRRQARSRRRQPRQQHGVAALGHDEGQGAITASPCAPADSVSTSVPCPTRWRSPISTPTEGPISSSPTRASAPYRCCWTGRRPGRPRSPSPLNRPSMSVLTPFPWPWAISTATAGRTSSPPTTPRAVRSRCSWTPRWRGRPRPPSPPSRPWRPATSPPPWRWATLTATAEPMSSPPTTATKRRRCCWTRRRRSPSPRPSSSPTSPARASGNSTASITPGCRSPPSTPPCWPRTPPATSSPTSRAMASPATNPRSVRGSSSTEWTRPPWPWTPPATSSYPSGGAGVGEFRA